jgi:hypothetical protein
MDISEESLIKPRIGAITANDILITKLLKESTVALLSDVEFILIRFLSLGVIIPLNRYIKIINIKPK